MYSQCREEEVILNWFKNRSIGKLLDIGACDPFYLSNTRALIEIGFSGVLVEPVPSAVEIFKKEYKNNNKIEICSNAIDTTVGIKDFYIGQDSYLSTLSKEFTQNPNLLALNFKYKLSKVEAITPNMLFEKYGYDFDFIDLDVEGSNWDILQLIPFEKLNKLSLICIEHKHDDFKTINSFMIERGFTEVYKNTLNVIYKKDKG